MLGCKAIVGGTLQVYPTVMIPTMLGMSRNWVSQSYGKLKNESPLVALGHFGAYVHQLTMV